MEQEQGKLEYAISRMELATKRVLRDRYSGMPPGAVIGPGEGYRDCPLTGRRVYETLWWDGTSVRSTKEL